MSGIQIPTVVHPLGCFNIQLILCITLCGFVHRGWFQLSYCVTWNLYVAPSLHDHVTGQENLVLDIHILEPNKSVTWEKIENKILIPIAEKIQFCLLPKQFLNSFAKLI